MPTDAEVCYTDSSEACTDQWLAEINLRHHVRCILLAPLLRARCFFGSTVAVLVVHHDQHSLSTVESESSTSAASRLHLYTVVALVMSEGYAWSSSRRTHTQLSPRALRRSPPRFEADQAITVTQLLSHCWYPATAKPHSATSVVLLLLRGAAPAVASGPLLFHAADRCVSIIDVVHFHQLSRSSGPAAAVVVIVVVAACLHDL
eukprot:20722-Heterococcus_DN1.PRE.3